MEEKKKYEELQSILAGLQKALRKRRKRRKNVSDIFICVYNDKHVGLFKKINWSTKMRNQSSSPKYAEYDAGSIYVGIDSNYIGMEETHLYNQYRNLWQPAGEKIIVDGKNYVSNCVMQNSMSFDDMRLIMYCKELIGPYEIGKASSKEIIDVLKYASSYYQLDQNIQKQKK